MHQPSGFHTGRRIGEPPLPLGWTRKLGQRGRSPISEHGEPDVDLGAECARIAAERGWDAMPEWCSTESGDPGYASPRRGMGSVPGALGWIPPAVRIQGIPNPVAAPTVSDRTWRVEKIRKDRMGTLDTMVIMREMALESATDASFIEDARSIARECPARDYRCVMAADLEFVRKRIRYQEGPLGETEEDGVVYQYLMSPGYLLYVAGQGLCADMSTLISGLLTAQGIGSGFRGVYLDPARPRGSSHVYAMGFTKDGAFAVDPVPNGSRVGDEPPRAIWIAPPLDFAVATT